MTTPTDSHRQECFPRTTMEDYALGRLHDAVRSDLERHVKECAACATRLRTIRDESTAFQNALRTASSDAHEGCYDRETLALYLDRSLDEEERDRLELHISSCRRCQGELVGLYREVSETLAGEGVPELGAKTDQPLREVFPVKPKQAEKMLGFRGRHLFPVALGAGLLVLALGSTLILSSTYLVPLIFLAFCSAAFLGTEILLLWMRDTRAVSAHPEPQQHRVRTLLLAGAGAFFAGALIWAQATVWLLAGAAACWSAWISARAMSHRAPLPHREARLSAPGHDKEAEVVHEEERQRPSAGI